MDNRPWGDHGLWFPDDPTTLAFRRNGRLEWHGNATRPTSSRLTRPVARRGPVFGGDQPMLLLKPGVRITGIRPELLIAVMAAERVFDHAGHDLMLTACIDGKHMAGSLHYSGLAVDIRTKNVPATDVPELITRIKACVGGDFDVILEADHIHVEFQPKNAITA
jgi:hypothetical protein